MPAFHRKYNTASHVYVPLIKRGVVDFAVGADFTPAAGDVKISKDGGAAANVTNLPVAIAMGNAAIWDFSLTAAELSAAKVVVTVADAATKAVEDTAFLVETYGNASAEYQQDLSAAKYAATLGSADYSGNTVQTGDSFARIGATGSGLTSLAPSSTALSTAVWTNGRAIFLDHLDADVTSRLAPTVGGRTLDVSATGEAGLDWANIGSPTTAVNLSGTTISTNQAVASVSGSVGSIASGGIDATSFTAGAINAAAIATDAIGSAELATTAVTEIVNAIWNEFLPGLYGAGTAGQIIGTNLNATVGSRSNHSAADVWAVATRVLTAGTNIALAKGTGITGFTDLDASGVRAAVGMTAANLDTQLATIAAYIDTEVAAIKAVTDKLATMLVIVGAGPNYQYTVQALANASAGGGGGGLDDYAKARIYGEATVNADRSIDFADVTDPAIIRVRLGPKPAPGGRTVTLDPT
jgi:hypothetical protein